MPYKWNPLPWKFDRTESGSTPPVATTYTANDASTATPAANNLNLFALDSTQDNDNGITTIASGSTVTTLLTNRIQGVVTTNGASNADIVTFALGVTPACFTFEVKLTCFSPLNSVGAGFSLFGAAKTDGVTATIIATPDKIYSKDALINASDVNFVASGGSFVVRVTGEIGITDLNWSAVGLYTRVI